MKKIIFVFLGVLLFAYSCTKEEDKITENLNDDTGMKTYLSVSYDADYYPNENVESLIQTFFDKANNYDEDSNITIASFELNSGIWQLMTAINYVSSNSFAELDNFSTNNTSITIEKTESSSDYLNGKSVLKSFLSLYNYMKLLSDDQHEIGAISIKSIEDNSTNIILNIEALIGVKVEYEDVDIEGLNPPIGIPGYSYISMQNAAKKNAMRYNPYLYKARTTNLSNPFQNYIFSNYSSNSFDDWTDYNNCHYQWPQGDYILYMDGSVSINNYKSYTVPGSRFNMYLLRYFNKKVINMVNNNINYNMKFLYLAGYPSYLSGCSSCNYISPNDITSVLLVKHTAILTGLSNILTTYTY